MVKMRTVGDVLREAREKQKLSYEEIAEQTRIKVSHLEAIEEGNYGILPPAPFAKGLIKNYAQFLQLNPEELLAIYRREVDEQRAPVQAPLTPNTQKLFRLTPSHIFRYAIIFIILVFSGYFLHEYQVLTGSPQLMVELPKQNSIVEGSSVVVQGKTSPEATVQVNGQTITVNQNGAFATTIDLITNNTDTSNVTNISITASNKYNKVNTIERTIILQK